MEKKLNILHFPEWYPHSEDDMAGIFIQKHIEAIQQVHNCCVLYCSPRKQDKLIELTSSIENNIMVVRVFYRNNIFGITLPNKLIKVPLYIFAVRKGIRFVRKNIFKEDLLHVHIASKNSQFVRWFYRKQFVITEHWSKYLKTSTSYTNKKVFQKAKGISAVSEVLKNRMQRLGIVNDNFVTIPNVVDEKVFFYRSSPAKRDVKKILHVSEFNEEAKNIRGILTSVADLKKAGRPIQLILVGYGKDQALILKAIDEMGINDCVDFKGKLYPKELADLMTECDLFVLNSRYETFGIVLIEALLCGCPVVSTPVGVAPEVINDKNGIIINDNLTKSMQIALNTEYDRREIASEQKGKYDNTAVQGLFSDFYKKALR